MKRRILCCVMVVGLAAMLSACQKNQNSESVGTSQAEETASSEELSDDNANGSEESQENPEVVPVAVAIEQVSDTWTEDRGCEIYQYPRFCLEGEDQAAYPKLSQTFESYNRQQDAQKDDRLKSLQEDYEGEREFLENADAWQEMSIKTTATALRADSHVVSFLCEYDAEFGGAHPYSYVYGMNYDTKTGKELVLGDVVKDKEAFIELVADAFDREYSVEEYGELTNGGEALKECDFDSEDGVLWSIDPVCVTVYFATYDLGTYSQGEQVVSIYFDQAPEIFDEYYTTACEDYILPITYRKPLSIPTASGQREKIQTEFDDVDYEMYKSIFVIGDTEIETQWESYDTDPYLVHVNGKNYIYAFQSAEGDWGYLNVVDADNKSLDDEKNLSERLMQYYRFHDEGDRYGFVCKYPAFTDPSQFVLRSKVDVLGTYEAYKNYHVGSDGYPVSEDALYLSVANTAFRAIKEIECDTVDQEGNVTGKASIPAESFLAVVRTDADSIVDMQIIAPSYIEDPEDTEWPIYYLKEDLEEIFDPNGTIYRVTIGMSEFSETVNGEDEGSLFEGILWAD